MICHLILLMVETDEGFNSPLPLRSVKVAGDNFQDFSDSYTLTDQYYHCTVKDPGNIGVT